MENLNIIGSIASILGFILSLIVLFKVNKIENRTNNMDSTQQNNNTVRGDQAGRDIRK